MKTDLYTKGILTVIAVALMVIAFKDFPPKAIAEPPLFKSERALDSRIKQIIRSCSVRGAISNNNLYNGRIHCG